VKELFVFVADPEVPPENNAAERSLRYVVTSRKISGGTRSEQGTYSRPVLSMVEELILSSLFGT
jgi:transposase